MPDPRAGFGADGTRFPAKVAHPERPGVRMRRSGRPAGVAVRGTGGGHEGSRSGPVRALTKRGTVVRLAHGRRAFRRRSRDVLERCMAMESRLHELGADQVYVIFQALLQGKDHPLHQAELL